MRWDELISLRELTPIKDDNDFDHAIKVMEMLKTMRRDKIVQAYFDFTATMIHIYEQG